MEQQFFETVLQRLPESTREQLDALLERYKEEEGEAELEEEEPGIQNLQPEERFSHALLYASDDPFPAKYCLHPAYNAALLTHYDKSLSSALS